MLLWVGLLSICLLVFSVFGFNSVGLFKSLLI